MGVITKVFQLSTICLSALVLQSHAQTDPSDTLSNFSDFHRSLSFAGLLQTRYVASLSHNVDVNGLNYDTSTHTPVNNTFLVKRARLQVRANVNDHFGAYFMMNFADFSSSNLSGKVLENAFVKYSLNKHFNIQAGQFRPFFGVEDIIPVDIIRTLDFSNQYYAFGSNGWQSFQIGVTILGTITGDNQIPLRYYAGVYNGNNKNQPTDNDNTKNLYARLDVDPVKDLTLGVNGGTGSMAGSGTGNAWGGSITGKFNLSTEFKLLFSGEFKSGTNFTNYNNASGPKSLDQYRMHGFYLFPILRYEYKRPRVRAIELSTRYEYLDLSYRLNSNPRQTIIPNLSFIFADNFYAALQMGVSIDLYKTNVPLTTAYDQSLAYVQLQIRF